MKKKSIVRVLVGFIIAIVGVIALLAFEDALIIATGLGSIDPATLQLVETVLAVIIGLTITAVVLVLVLFTLIKTIE